jgi:hypothetical protein
MATRKCTDITGLGPKEAENQERATKYLEAASLLIGDIELLYLGITPLLKAPQGGIDAPDQLALFFVIANKQLMISRMLYTKAIIAALRMYQADSLTHLRRVIEVCAFTVRMSKHRELCKVWSEAGLDDAKYEAYRKAFRTAEVFPKQGHPDHDPLLTFLKDRFDLGSKLIHGSVFGSANHFATVPKGANTPTRRNVNFFDMPADSFPSTYFMILTTNLVILELYGKMFKPHMTESAGWEKEYKDIKERVDRDLNKWKPTIMQWNARRYAAEQ